jgi:NAD-dependent SIR2 family protein deacetylase
MVDDRTARAIGKVARLIAEADALLITAGAGMGVDSGLPDFRGSEGFWRAYPALGLLKIPFEEMAQPQWFAERPEMAWAFYGHRQQLYRETKPHMGFSMLLDWGRAMPAGYFVVTSNVDGQFEKAGFPAERILEQHGSIHRLQCSRPCCERIWFEETTDLDIDLETITARGRLPRCPECGDVARPNVLMFVDPDWLAIVTREQERRYRQWLASVRGRRLVIVELGAGTAIATIRSLGERLASERERVTLVRVNPDAADSEEPVIPVRLGALEGLRRIEERLPDAFKAAARAGRRIERLTAAPQPATSAVAPANTGGLRPLPPEHMDTIEFFETPIADTPSAWLSAAPNASEELRSVSAIDLDNGQIEPFNFIGISTADEQACMNAWFGPHKDKYVPLPEVGGLAAPGYLTTGHVVRAGDPVAGRRPGAAIMYLCDAERRIILTFGVARRPLEGAQLWRMLYEDSAAAAQAKALDFPRVPWIARRLGPAAKDHAAMLPVLGRIERALAWTWLRLQAYYEQNGTRGAQ